jgi:hypothetical protein
MVDVQPSRARSPHVLIRNSVCPLGTEFARLARERGLSIVDVRGPAYLNLTVEAARAILNQINITKVAVLCAISDTISRVSTGTPRVFSVVGGPADVEIQVPPIWGTVRGEQTASVENNWFSECICGLLLTRSKNLSMKFALANWIAAIFYSIIRENTFDTVVDLRNELTFEWSKLFEEMKSA